MSAGRSARRRGPSLHGEPTLSPKPPWFVTNRTSGVTARRLTAFAAKPQVRRLPGILISALRG